MKKTIVLKLKFKNEEKKHLIVDDVECIVNKYLQSINGIQLHTNHLYEKFGIKGKNIFNKCVIESITESEYIDENNNTIKGISLLISFKSVSK